MKWWRWLRQRFCSHPETYTEWEWDELIRVWFVSYTECVRCGKNRGEKADD